LDLVFRDRFLDLWRKHFGGAELPLVFQYTDELGEGPLSPKRNAVVCIVGQLDKPRRGETLYFNAEGVNCRGGKRYMGFAQTIMPGFEYFLSCGIPGKLKGEHYKKAPEFADAMIKRIPPYQAPGKYLVFKRWDKLTEDDQPEVVFFFAEADVLSALYSLANYDESDPNAVITPHCAGCAHIVHFPYLERLSDHPRAVIGMFDIHARPYVQKSVLSFAAPMSKFRRMVDNMDDSFLPRELWTRVKRRITPSPY